MQRPQEIYAQLFERQGLRFEQNEQGITIFGRLCPGTFTLPGNVSSQFISGLLFATPLMEAPSAIEVRAPFESRSYVDLTTDAMQKFGVKVFGPRPQGWLRHLQSGSAAALCGSRHGC